MARFLLPLLLLLLPGCSSMTDLKNDINERFFGQDSTEPAAALTDIKTTLDAKVLWHASLGSGGEYDFTPALDAGAVYAAAADGSIDRLDAASGKQEWRVGAGEKLSGGVGAGEKLVLVGTPKGMVLAFEQAGGKPLWRSRISSEILSAPRISGGVVVVRGGDSRIFGLSAADGKRKWVYERATPALTLRSSAGVTIADGVAYVGFAGGKLVALAVDDGKVLWEASVAQPKGATEIERIADITSLPQVDGRYVYAVAYQGRIACVDRGNGHVLWNRDISSYTGLGIDDTHLFISHSGGSVYSVDYSSGKSYWRQGALLNRQISAPLPIGRYVAVGDLEGYVHFMDREDGTFVARVKTDSNSAVMAQMVQLNSATLLAQTRGGGLYAISLK
jgi:outer membrane protein assembly factor BamB